ncbi:hypothetical protein SCP_0301560 [Sparassis crispa]|uniref:Uncharacterized protein n=1 Tax=Sparassis crispa TaxID=139825 RepID=A0A401GE78_9APHY|nr:hypothetical protein SCP_0301560 [Sparassis crispa]GBE80441.1 hypothetical protein SCP_0301560 [Sparassis crispa]
MSSLISHLLSCCLRSHSPVQGEADERTHLIPETTITDIPQPRSYVVDQQKLKDRLGTIVRAKEGKMVNVNTPLPFNLHHKSFPETSRSASTSGQRGPSDTEAASRSREPSRSIETSRSTSSLHPGDASYLPPSEPAAVRRPILNARLVRTAIRRGRSATRGRMGRFGDDARDAGRQMNGNGGGIEHGGVDASSTEPQTEDVYTAEADAPAAASAAVQENADIDTEATPHALDVGFQIADVGKIAQSWGE